MTVFAWLMAMLMTTFPIPSFPPPVLVEVHQVASLMDILRNAGFTGEGLRIAYAVAMAESSGNAKAYNGNANTGDKSYGLFQINMLGAMGPERLRQYGLSSNEDLFDPNVNARVAFKMSQGGTAWRPWSTYNRGDYKKYLGGSGATVSNASSSSPGGGGTATPMSRGETAESYGFVEAMMNSDPDLKRLFNDAVKGGWSAQKFQAALRDTNWFKTHNEKERAFLAKQYGDPATANSMWHEAQVKIRQMAAQVGASFGWDVINDLAYGMMAKGWTEGELRMKMSEHLSFGDTGDVMGGEAAKTAQELHSYAWSMGIDLDKKWYQYAAMGAVSGKNSIEDFKSDIRQWAKGLYSSWSKQIDGGQSVMDLASPYMQSMSQILELPQGSVNLFDPTIKKALQYKDPTTGQGAVQQIWQFENDLRNDNRWKKTKNAQDSMMQVAHQVLSDFGVRF